MTTEEYLKARKSKNWKFNTVVDASSFSHVNRIHPIKQRMVKGIVDAAREDKAVRKIIIFGSSIRYDCDITSDLFLHWFSLAFIGGIICLSLNVFAFPRSDRHD